MVLWTFLWTEGLVFVWSPGMMNITTAELKLGVFFGSTEYTEKIPSGSLGRTGRMTQMRMYSQRHIPPSHLPSPSRV